MCAARRRAHHRAGCRGDQTTAALDPTYLSEMSTASSSNATSRNLSWAGDGDVSETPVLFINHSNSEQNRRVSDPLIYAYLLARTEKLTEIEKG